MTLPLIGDPVVRVDGRQKVTGAAQFCAEVHLPDLAYAEIVTSTVANGSIKQIDASGALEVGGVLLVLTHENAPKVNAGKAQPYDSVLQLLQDNRVRYDRQPVAVVVAQTAQQAKHAAMRLRITYDARKPVTRIEAAPQYEASEIFGEEAQHTRGDPDTAFERAPIRLENVYTTPMEHHNPIEAHAAVALWEGDRLTVHASSQHVFGARRRLAHIFGLPEREVRVICQFVGGGFGCKGQLWSHVPLAAMAAKVLQLPVRVEISREQMFGFVGYRPPTIQTIALGSDTDGRLQSVMHDTLTQTCDFDEWLESSGLVTRMLYSVPNLRSTHRLARLNAAKPTFMRAPGESTGTFAIESAMDELAYACGIDPIELRVRNYAERDPDSGRPFSSKSLRECYRVGAQRFGWSARNPKPASMRNGRKLVGMGMATAAYPAWRSEASAYIRMSADGRVWVQSATHELGTGSYTIFSQIAARVLRVPVESVIFELGDTTLPEAPISAGSQSAAAVGHAVYLAAVALRDRILDGFAADGADVDYASILRKRGLNHLDAHSTAHPSEKEEEFSAHAFGAQFAQVEIDPDLGEVRVTKWTGAFAGGRVLNAMTARSQLIGGIVFGIGMTLTEESVSDARTGRIMSANLVDYHLPVNADVPPIEIHLIEEKDEHVNPLGIKGLGEIGITGAAAAIANAVYHATGERIRDLPIVPEKILERTPSAL